MKLELIKKYLKEVSGLSDETINKMTAAEATDEAVTALFPEASQASRSKWEAVLTTDQNFKKPIFDAGYGQGTKSLKKKVKDVTGLDINEESPEFADADIYIQKLSAHYEKAKAKIEGGDKEEMQRLKTNFENEKAAAIRSREAELRQSFQSEKMGILQAVGKEKALINHGANLKLKGGLSAYDMLPIFERKLDNYKVEYDERGNIQKMFNIDGSDIWNEGKDKVLTKEEVLSQIFAPYVDTTPAPTPEPPKSTGTGTTTTQVITTLGGSAGELSQADRGAALMAARHAEALA